MGKLILISLVALLSVALLLVCCQSGSGTNANVSSYSKNYWSLTQSPLTGKCYEVFSLNSGGGGINEIPCQLYEEMTTPR